MAGPRKYAVEAVGPAFALAIWPGSYWLHFGDCFLRFGVYFGAHYVNLGVILGTKMWPKPSWGHLWGPMASPQKTVQFGKQ